MSKKKEYFILEPSNFRLDGGAMYGIIPKPLWEKLSPPDNQNRIDLSLRLLLIKSKNQNILIDTGIGDYHNEKFFSMFDIRSHDSPLEKALKSCDVLPEQITDVIISHLHFDHVGGLLKMDKNNEIIPIFQNAKLHLHKKHYDYALNPTLRDIGSFQSQYFSPIIDYYHKNNLINWIDSDEGEIIPSLNINFKTSFGHTPHLLHPYDENFFYLTDLIPTANHVKISWVMGYDINPGLTTKYKEKILSFIAEKKLTVIYEHDPLFWGGFIIKNEKGRYQSNNLEKRKQTKTYSIKF